MLEDFCHRFSKDIFRMAICVGSFVHRFCGFSFLVCNSPHIASLSSTIKRLNGSFSTCLSSIRLLLAWEYSMISSVNASGSWLSVIIRILIVFLSLSLRFFE